MTKEKRTIQNIEAVFLGGEPLCCVKDVATNPPCLFSS
ncbi:hypothetical protein BRO54_1720 [Geobacillus proteiniphilus]|uniref:Uncharacterized protein n=1 Tax=Geobacillus proteiniphilus TaxID=860353 RepID=A0A1Q5T1W5_9BACL|nr:hypothetical protein BRO54_1720 [Geobacillus proteiniphilus]